jgi:hypothetical protein
VQLERQLIARLKTANIRFTDAQVERIWAIVSAHHAGLSIRKIAGATGLSSSRIHQLLNATEAKEIPVWLSQVRQSSGVSGRKKKLNRLSRKPRSDPAWREKFRCCNAALIGCSDWSVAKTWLRIFGPMKMSRRSLLLSTDRGWSVCWNESQPTWIPSAWYRMTRTRTKNRTTMILEHVIATSWPSRHRSQRS